MCEDGNGQTGCLRSSDPHIFQIGVRKPKSRWHRKKRVGIAQIHCHGNVLVPSCPCGENVHKVQPNVPSLRVI